MSTELENVKKQEEEYSASNIQVLEGLEAVRKRPAMYIGDIGEKGLHHLVYEVVDNSIDEALAGYCTDIDVTINEDNSITVKDNGRGIPTDYHEKEGKSALEVVLTVLHAGGKFDKGSYKVSGGLHGVGVSCVNALSTLLIAEIHSRDGKIYRQTYSKGAPTSQVEVVGECTDRGTIITFKPDGSIFTHTTEYKYDILANRLRELAFLNKGISLNLYDKRPDEEGKTREDHFYSEEGLKEFVKYLDATRGTPIVEQIIYLDTEKNGVPVEVAMQYNDSFSENVHSYVNNINTIEGGTHLTGFRRALTRTLKKYAEDSGMLAKLKFDINGDDFREGLTAVVSVKVQEPQFEGQTKTKLGNDEVAAAVDQALASALGDYLEENPKDAKAIVQKEVDGLKALGVKVETNMVIGRVVSIDELMSEYGFEAVFIGSGAGLPMFMHIPGENLCGVYSANEFLTRINLMKAYKDGSDTPIMPLAGKKVAVVGGGNVAMDAARCSKRLGADVYVVYRRGMEELPARHEEVEHAIEEGIVFKTLNNPVKINGDEKGYVSSMTCVEMELGEPDASGRRRPIEKVGSEHDLPVDCVIMSLGTTPNPLIKNTTPGLEVNRKGGIVVNEAGLTSHQNVYAGGDAVTGAATVILAMGAGKLGAKSIDEALSK